MTQFTADANALPYPEGTDRVAVAADIKALSLNTSRAITAEGARAVETAAKNTADVATLRRGVIPNGTDLNALSGVANAGIWSVNTPAAVATMLNAPTITGNLPYSLEVRAQSNGITTQILIPYSSGFNIWARAAANTSGTAWGAWKKVVFDDGSLLSLKPSLAVGADLNAVTSSGDYPAASATISGSLLNAPTPNPGIYRIRTTTNGIVSQEFHEYGTGKRFSRITQSIQGNAFTPWDQEHSVRHPSAGGPNATRSELALRSRTLRDAFITSRGGSIGTAGRPVVSIKYDHDLNALFETVVPLHDTHNIPGSVSVMGGMFTDANGVARNDKHTWADVQALALNKGWEVLNHFWSHRDVQTDADLFHEIVDPLAVYREQMPKVAVVGATLPGPAPLPGYTTQYGGFGNGATVEAWADTYAGQLLQGHHGYAMGYMPGRYRSLDGQPTVGLGHHTLDSMTDAATAIQLIESAKSFGAGISFMVHPSLIGTEGKITAAVLNELLAYMASERDAGRIEVMTASGLTLADIRHGSRFNLLPNGDFRTGLTGWSGVTGWSAENGKATANVSAGVMSLTQSIAGLGQFYGTQCEMSAVFRAGTSDVVVRVQVEDASAPDNMRSFREETIPAGMTTRVRAFATVPATGTTALRFQVGRVSGGPVDELSGVRFSPV